MRIAIVGDWRNDIYEDSMFRAVTELGHLPGRFQIFGSEFDRRLLHFAPGCVQRLRARMVVTPLLTRIRQWRPDLIFCWRPEALSSRDVVRLKRACGVPVVYYHNDNPQSLRWGKRLLSSVSAYDMCFGYRPADLEVYRRYGARQTALLMPYSLPWSHFPPPDGFTEALGVTFVGHYENDGRRDIVAALLSSGVEVNIWGPQWDDAGLALPPRAFSRITTDQYRSIVWGSTVALSFLSGRNRDVYTRRSFELPAMGACILSQRTTELSSLFPEGESAMYFDSPVECVAVARELLRDPVLRVRLREGGLSRHKAVGGNIHSRMQEVLQVVGSL